MSGGETVAPKHIAYDQTRRHRRDCAGRRRDD
jgi:hypothetical protein